MYNMFEFMIAFFLSFLQKRRGVSQIMAAMLLIGLLIVMTAVFWAFLSGWLDNQVESISNGTDNLP